MAGPITLTMSNSLPDCDLKPIYPTAMQAKAQTWDSPESAPASKARSSGDSRLSRSFSKSDSDLLSSLTSEEEEYTCNPGEKQLERSPSYTSEWDEVRAPAPLGAEGGGHRHHICEGWRRKVDVERWFDRSC